MRFTNDGSGSSSGIDWMRSANSRNGWRVKMTTEMRYVYVTYIVSTAEKVWQALTDPSITPHYWFHRKNVSDWKPGSEWRHQDVEDNDRTDCVGKVLESDPSRRLVTTWAAPGWETRNEKPSKVTIEIISYSNSVKLTVIHEELSADDYKAISH